MCQIFFHTNVTAQSYSSTSLLYLKHTEFAFPALIRYKWDLVVNFSQSHLKVVFLFKCGWKHRQLSKESINCLLEKSDHDWVGSCNTTPHPMATCSGSIAIWQWPGHSQSARCPSGSQSHLSGLIALLPCRAFSLAAFLKNKSEMHWCNCSGMLPGDFLEQDVLLLSAIDFWHLCWLDLE